MSGPNRVLACYSDSTYIRSLKLQNDFDGLTLVFSDAYLPTDSLAHHSHCYVVLGACFLLRSYRGYHAFWNRAAVAVALVIHI